MSIYVLSFDVGTKNLAVVLVKFVDYSREIQEIYKYFKAQNFTDKNELNRILKMYSEFKDFHINILYANLFDLTPTKFASNTTLEERTNALKKTLMLVDKELVIYPNYVLVEYQMVQNNITQLLMAQIMYHYAPNAITVGPSLKQQVYTTPENRFEIISSKYKTGYSANKAFSSQNLKAWIKNRPKYDYILKFAKLSDIGDAFLMAIAWYYKYYL